MAITKNPLDWANKMYGTPTTGYAGETNIKNARLDNPYSTDAELYQNLFQANRQMPLSGSAAGSADFLAGYAQRNVPSQTSGMSPVSFNPLLGPEGVVNPNATLTGPGKTLTQVENEAYSQYLSSAMQQRDLSRQGIQAAGGDRYQQARLAMEQQRGLSDTRGLTAGARQGASDQLSAAQQVAFNQIESSIRSELTQLKQQGIQDEFLAQEYAARKVEQFKQTNPQWGKLESISRNYQDALARGDADLAATSRSQMFQLEAELLGFADDPDFKELQTAKNSLEISARTTRIADRIMQEPDGQANFWNGFLAVAGIVGGTALLVGGVATAVFSGGTLSVPGLAAGFKGGLMIAAGLTALGFGSFKGAVVADQNLTVEQKRAKIDRLYAEERADLLKKGFDAAEIDKAIAEDRAKLFPAYR